MNIHLENLEPDLHAMLTGGGDYFDLHADNHTSWLGRFFDDVIDLPSLELAKSNILSLRQRFFNIPDASSEDVWLFPVTTSD